LKSLGIFWRDEHINSLLLDWNRSNIAAGFARFAMLFVGTPITDNFLRTIKSKDFSAHFKVLYDVVYSKVDLASAEKMLQKFFPEDLLDMELEDVDLGKVILVAWDILRQLERPESSILEDKLQGWFMEFGGKGSWKKLKERYEELL